MAKCVRDKIPAKTLPKHLQKVKNQLEEKRAERGKTSNKNYIKISKNYNLELPSPITNSKVKSPQQKNSLISHVQFVLKVKHYIVSLILLLFFTSVKACEYTKMFQICGASRSGHPIDVLKTFKKFEFQKNVHLQPTWSTSTLSADADKKHWRCLPRNYPPVRATSLCANSFLLEWLKCLRPCVTCWCRKWPTCRWLKTRSNWWSRHAGGTKGCSKSTWNSRQKNIVSENSKNCLVFVLKCVLTKFASTLTRLTGNIASLKCSVLLNIIIWKITKN